MPFGAVVLKPSVDIERTYSANEAGISFSQLVRFRADLIETYGGWETFISAVIPSTIRDLQAWQTTDGDIYLGVAATSNLLAVTGNNVTDITPETFTTNPAPSLSTTIGSNQVTVVDSNSGATVYNTVFFNTPISVGGLFLNGAYQIASILSTGSYTINSSIPATATVATSGILPLFDSSSGSAFVTVTAPDHTAQVIAGVQFTFRAPTTVGGLTISGPYGIFSSTSATTFVIVAENSATATATSTMNAGLAQLVYYVTGGPPTGGTGYGAGGYGTGAYGGGGSLFPSNSGLNITSSDWTQENWGEILLSCPEDGPIYQWSPQSGFVNGQPIATAPFFNGGIFTSMPQQILVAWRSVQSSGTQDNLIVRWSDSADFTNWEVTNATSAGSFHIPTGSIIMGGLQAANYGVIWTDIEVWTMSYVGGDVIFNFSKVGTGCGLLGSHACGVIGGDVYWAGQNNFFRLGSGGVEAIPCTVWDFFYQNLNQDYAWKIRCAPNSSFNEMAWFFPATGSTENNAYVKLNIATRAWDYGFLSRTAWIDSSVLGQPIGSDTSGFLYQHETGNVQSGASATSFQTGWWAIAEGSDFAFVDYVIPDFIWGTYGNDDASVIITFYSVNYPGETPRTYGPYTITRGTEYLTPRIRGRLMSASIQAASPDFWRLGRIRYRFAGSGRR